jgi:hypothetical protein
MIGKLFGRRVDPSPLLSSRLYNEQTFYTSFLHDLRRSRKEVLVESPFITKRRMNEVYPMFRKLTRHGVRITINTRDPREQDLMMRVDAESAVVALQDIGVLVLFTDSHHRKLAIIDGRILWEGSLNILSQNASCEIMRRIESRELAQQMLKFTKLEKFLG